MPLTDVRIRQSKPTDKPYRLFDSGNLFIEIRPNGSKLWRYQYRIAKKQNLYAIGAYPEVTLQDARSEHERARALVAKGVHPSHERARTRSDAIAKSADTFKLMAEEWYAGRVDGWSPTYADQVRSYLEKDVYPKIGRRPIRSITPADALDVVKAIAGRGAEAAAILVRQMISQVFTYAIANLKADTDPTYPIRRAIVRPPVQHADAKSPEVVGDLLFKIRRYGGNRKTVLALYLMLYLFGRTAELRKARWAEFNLDGALWSVEVGHMKKRRKHLVPLPPVAVELLRELFTITGAGEHLFPNNRRPNHPMSATTVNRALEHMGYESGYFTGHDFRATASTQLHEMGYRTEIVDMQLAHAKKDKTSASYNHAKYLPERTRMMNEWADWIASLPQVEVIQRRPGGSRTQSKSRRAA